jgi:hypothetical protein
MVSFEISRGKNIQHHPHATPPKEGTAVNIFRLAITGSTPT